MRYLFGDTNLAAHRLELLAEAFQASSRSFLQTHAGGPVAQALDLGCGPGFTTHLMAEAVPCDHALGLDRSANFIDLATLTATGRVSFAVHDVTHMPFALGPYNLIYARFLLGHLPNAASLVAPWATQLQPGGRLLIEEVESVETPHATFKAYLEMIKAMLKSQASDLYAGPLLNRVAMPAGLRKRASEVRQVPVAANHAAAMFFLNLRNCKGHPFVRQHYPSNMILELEQELDRLRDGSDSQPPVVWRLRQLVVERH